MKKLNITFCSFPDYAGNAKALYEYMEKRYKKNMNYTWIVYNEESVKKLKDFGIKAILIGTDEFKKYIPKTNVFFTTQGNLDGDKIKAKNSVYIELWHGIGPKQGGFAQDNPSEQDKEGYDNINEIVDYFIAPSEFWRIVYAAVFKTEFLRIKTLGLPILDYFNNSDGKANLEKIINKDTSKYKKIIIYMPTFKKGFNHVDVKQITNNIFNFEKEYDEKELDDFLKKNNYLLCAKKHPGEQAKLNFNNSNNIVKIEEKELQKYNITVNEIINAFDMLITDYSSIGTEFTFLERPILYAAGDINEYKENRGLLFGELDFWAAGPICSNIKETLKEMKRLLEDKEYYKEERIKAKRVFFGDRKDGGCKEICDFLFEGNEISKEVQIHQSSNQVLKEKNRKLKKKIEKQEGQIARLNNESLELKQIKKSKGWKMLEKMRKAKRTITRK